jgi:hypothetical protein
MFNNDFVGKFKYYSKEYFVYWNSTDKIVYWNEKEGMPKISTEGIAETIDQVILCAYESLIKYK